MKAVTPAIIKVIIELQALPTISKFSLGGGTNLVLQFNYRVSDDIDLFCNGGRDLILNPKMLME